MGLILTLPRRYIDGIASIPLADLRASRRVLALDTISLLPLDLTIASITYPFGLVAIHSSLPHLLDENRDAGTPPVRLPRPELDDRGVVGDHKPGQRVEHRPSELVHIRAARPIRGRLFDLLSVASRPEMRFGAGQVKVELHGDGRRPQRLMARLHRRLRRAPNVGTPRRYPLRRLHHPAIPEIPLRSLRGGIARYEEVE